MAIMPAWKCQLYFPTENIILMIPAHIALK